MVELGPVNQFLAPNPYIGNNLFHYCWGREIANKKGYYLKTKKIEGFPSTYNDFNESSPGMMSSFERSHSGHR